MRLAVGLAAAALLLVPAASADGQAPKRKRIETVVRSKAPDARRVIESYVRLYAPLPAGTPPHPRACDWVGYLRFRPRQVQRRRVSRRRNRPPRPATADAVVTGMPGFLGGAASLDQIARHVVARASRRGRRVEFWAIDRRANCLEDHRGVNAAKRARSPDMAVNYYFNGAEVNGRRFAGFKSSDDVPFLDGFGLERTLRDWRTVMVREMPRRRARARKLICGGHSLGGPLTASFAAWDFDGNPQTTRDAGYKQCAGFYGLDTSLSLEESDGEGGIKEAANSLLAGSGQGRFVDAPPATPETIQLLGPSGVAGFYLTDQESGMLNLVPRTPKIEATFRVLFSRNTVEFATGIPNVRDFRLAGGPIVAGTFDDNSSPISIFRASVGVFDGGPVVEKDFPMPSAFAGLSGDNRLMAPQQDHGPLYTWRNYDRVGAPDAPRQVDRTGQPFTSPDSEVSDLRQLARALFEAPADFTEQYFPTRIMSDVLAAQQGDRSGSLANLRHEGVPLRPSVLIQAEKGIGVASSSGGSGGAEREVTLAGYDHLDVATAAARQNNGRPEGSTLALARLVRQVLAARRGRRAR